MTDETLKWFFIYIIILEFVLNEQLCFNGLFFIPQSWQFVHGFGTSLPRLVTNKEDFRD